MNEQVPQRIKNMSTLMTLCYQLNRATGAAIYTPQTIQEVSFKELDDMLAVIEWQM